MNYRGKQTKAKANRRQYERKLAAKYGPSTAGPAEATDLPLHPAPVSPEPQLRSPQQSTDFTRIISYSVHDLSLHILPFHPYQEYQPLSALLMPSYDIPDDLVARAQCIVHASFGVVCGEGPLLGLWCPPYRFKHANSNDILAPHPGESVPTCVWRAAILGAFQCRAILTAARDRRERWGRTCVEELEIEVQCEIAARVDAWTALRDSRDADSLSDDEQLALDWGSKIVYMLAEEWTCRRHGVEAYQEQLRLRMMPWQRLVSGLMAHSVN